MSLKKLLLIIPTSLAMVLAAIAIVIACMPSPRPPTCPQSIFIAKFTPFTVLIPPGGGAFNVPVGVLPFVTWNNTDPRCAMPANANVTVTLNCVSVFPPPPVPFQVGPQVFPVATPGTPGAQPLGGPLQVNIPGGLVPGPSICTVVGTYNVTFGGGVGGGLLQATGDTQICLVEPSPSDPSGDTPRLDLELLTPEPLPGRNGEDGVYTFHAGDQEYIYIRISNNDLERDAKINLKSDGLQVSGLPDGINNDEDAYNAGLFRISDTSGDVFPPEFFFEDDPLPFNRVPGDPGDPGPRRFEDDFTLEPGEVEVFGIAINSFGACADGSCNERNVCVEADMTKEGEDDEKTVACAQFIYLVDNALPPRYPGITFFDDIKVGDLVDTQWSTVKFWDPSGGLIDETHAGNLIEDLILPELLPGPAIQMTGQGLRPPTGDFFPNAWFDQITLPQPPLAARWESFFFYEDVGFQRRGNETILHGIDQLEEPCPFPTITLNQPIEPQTNFLRVVGDVRGGCNDNTPLELFELIQGQFQPIAQGTLGQLRTDQFLRIDDASCRTITIPQPPFGNNLDGLLLVPDPPFLLNTFIEPDVAPRIDQINFFDQFGNPVEIAGVRVVGDPGAPAAVNMGGGQIDLITDPTVLPIGLGTHDWFLTVEAPGFLNSPLAVPLIGRRLPPPQLLPVDFEFDAPPLAQVGSAYDAFLLIPPIDPEPVDPYFNMEFFIGIETNDEGIEIMIPEPFLIFPIDPDTPAPELERLRSKFGEDPINRCSEGVWKCGKIEFGDGFEFETEIFVDGFESGDVSSWSTGAAADNSQRKDKQQRVGVLDEDKKLPVITEEELRKAIELFNDDVVFDEKTIGLVSERFGVMEPLPPIRGTYFFDEFESFRKSAQAPVTIDGSRCPAPCSGLVLEGRSGGVSNIRFENFPNHGIVIKNDSLWIASNEFSGNGAGGILINGNNNFVADSLVRANRFEENGGPGITVESGTGNRLLFNTFTDGNGVFIDLGGDGATPNDDGDRDTGPNNLQNFPVLNNVLTGGSTTIQGTLNSTPGSSFSLQFFAWSDTLLRYLGEATVSTDANGDAPFNVVVEGTAENGQEVYATATDADGNTSEFSSSDVRVATEDEQAVPTTYVLYQNYPNPFNPTTTIRFDVPQAGPVRLVVFDVLGRQVALLVDEALSAGQHEAILRADDLPSGTYLYQLTGDGFTRTKMLVLLK